MSGTVLWFATRATLQQLRLPWHCALSHIDAGILVMRCNLLVACQLVDELRLIQLAYLVQKGKKLIIFFLLVVLFCSLSLSLSLGFFFLSFFVTATLGYYPWLGPSHGTLCSFLTPSSAAAFFIQLLLLLPPFHPLALVEVH